jgi:hypothetical protein
MRVVSEDVDYRVGLYQQDGTLIKLLDPVRFACISSPCTYDSRVSTTNISYGDILRVQAEIDYNENTSIWTLTWNDPTQNTHAMTLNITKESGDNSNLICSSVGSGFTGIITCNTTGYSGLMIGSGYRSASPLLPIIQKIVQIISSPFKGKTGLVLSAFIFLTVCLTGIISPILCVIFGIMAFIPGVLLGTIPMEVAAAFGVIGGIIIHFAMRSRG